jgi:PmbA protein
MPKHLGSSPFDAEGVPTQETMLISNGKLEHYLFNHYSARKMGNKSNTFRSSGNASRGDYHTTPGISGTNFYIPNGKTSPEAIIKNVKSGLYLMRLMGLHTANPVSGEFSLGAQGILIENGEKTSPVAGITISGNLLDILKGLEEIGNDLEFFPGGANYGSPTLMIRELSISGS